MFKYYLLFLAFFLSSCISEIDPSTISTKKPVVYCVFEEGKTWKLILQHSNTFADTKLTNHITDAEVIIYGSDGTVRQLKHLGGGYYWSDQNLPKHNISYTLIIQANGYPQVHATGQLPKPTPITIIQNEGLSQFEVRQDAKEDDIYIQIMMYENRQDVWENYFDYFPTSFKITNPELQQQVNEQTNNSLIHLENLDYKYLDHFFGKIPMSLKSIIITASPFYAENSFNNLQLNVLHFERQGYDYFFHQSKQKKHQDDLFSEPISFKGDVENGYGVFTGVNRYNWSKSEILHESLIAGTYKIMDGFSQHVNLKTFNFPNAEGYLKLEPDGRLFGQIRKDNTEVFTNLDGGWYLSDHKIRLYFTAQNFLKEVNLDWKIKGISARFSFNMYDSISIYFSKTNE